METERIEPGFETEVAESAGRTAGELLQAERQRRGLTEKSVANQLHITMHYVRAIESDHYDKLPGSVFAKGYVRSYATLLQLDENEIVRLYDQIAALKDEAAQEEGRLVAARQKKGRMLPWLVFAIIVFLVGILSFWVYNQYFSNADTLEPTAQVLNNPSVDQETGVVTAVSGAFDVDRGRAQETIVPSVNNAIAESDVSIDSIVVTESVEDNTTETSGNELGAELEQGPEGRITEVINIGSDQLLIGFTGVCWIELKDAGSSKVYREIQKPGDQLRITGTAPFTILLGDAPFVTMQLNGIEVDVSENIRIDNSARLTVGL